MPQQLTEDELEIVIKNTIQEIGVNSVKDLGKVMQAVMPKVRGRAEGRLVNQIAKRLLN